MKTMPSFALIGLLNAPILVAGKPAATSTPQTCSAPLITRLCDYKEPLVEFAVAEDTPGCWEFCHSHPPCDFAVFKVGNPYTGSGTCWLYPGEQFDPSQGKADGCEEKEFYVYGKPECSGGSNSGSGSGNGSPTATTDYTCAATASPSPIATICGYPEPGGNCFKDCAVSSGASDCLSLCAKSDSCDFAIFNPHNDDGTPFADGSCWKMKGKYDPKAGKACNGKPEQFVYENKCPKPPHQPSATKTSGSKATTAPGGGGSGGSGDSATAGASGASGSAGATASGKPGPVANNQSMASGLSIRYTLAIGVAALVLQSL